MNQSTGYFCSVVLFAACICATTGHVIVYPRVLESRSQESTKVLKINDDITLNLRRSTVFPEEFLVHTTEDGAPIAYHMLGADTEKNLYEDSEHMAAVHVSEEDGVMVEGVIGHTLRIKPLEGSERSSGGDIAHELYTISYPDTEKHLWNDYSVPNSSNDKALVESRDIKWYTRPRLPVSITPEVHVVVDHYISKALKFIYKKIARYVAILAASANLRYRSIIQPRVQLKIVGVSVTKTPQEEPYMVHVPGYEATRNILNDETRYKFKDYVLQQPYFKTADIVFLLTGLNLSEWEGNTLQHWIGGSAFLGGVCREWKVGMSEERPGSYYGVYVFAHEIAHSLGCQHDGDGASESPRGNIGSKDCPWSDGYIMSYAFKKPFLYQFSRCCQREIMNTYNRPEYKCLIQKNTLTTGIYSTKLPGDVSSRQVYCAQVYNQYTYVQADRSYSARSCLVRCFINRNGGNMLIGAVDGLACDKGKVCILGNCTSRAELKKAE